ncbi:hypothetical protein HanXRQr2_Chr03g0135071 [Helianthus annuus]|uniref:Uncharacterized protein n=1 Tax=Helianthus annuus TaxID=4232 RepID=A0A9K3JJV0_HELAN|nr:hypothetical protein HanXRQr2_Chr03g0135071 [Helianthus annuus]
MVFSSAIERFSSRRLLVWVQQTILCSIAFDTGLEVNESLLLTGVEQTLVSSTFGGAAGGCSCF